MKKAYHLWVLGVLLLGVLIGAFLGFFKSQEGFQTINPTAELIRCPPGYTFFNGPDGSSMCCKGTINPYTHKCEGSNAIKNNICALSANVRDPRSLFAGTNLVDCRALIAKETNAKSTASCPTSLPYFAQEDDATEKCCKNPVQIFGESGFTCADEDMKDTSNYCIAKGTPAINPTDGKQEKLCDEAKMIDITKCPTDVIGKKVFQNVTYTMGDREAKQYDIADLNGLTIPTCYRLNESCIPESVIEYSQKRGAFTDYDPKTWEYSCTVWSRKNRGEIVPGEVKGYLAPTTNLIA